MRLRGGCVTKYVWKKINESINRTVDEIDLKQLVEESKQVQQDLTVQKKCNNYEEITWTDLFI